MEESLTLLGQIKRIFECGEKDIKGYSPLTRAYIGDAIYDLAVRTVVVERANRPAHQLHKRTVEYVKAGAQSKMIQALLPHLTEVERDVYRRGRNAKPNARSRNADYGDYLKATGFEALMGYLYLTGQEERMLCLIKKGMALSGLAPL